MNLIFFLFLGSLQQSFFLFFYTFPGTYYALKTILNTTRGGGTRNRLFLEPAYLLEKQHNRVLWFFFGMTRVKSPKLLKQKIFFSYLNRACKPPNTANFSVLTYKNIPNCLIQR